MAINEKVLTEKQRNLFEKIFQERRRQEQLKADGKFPHTAADRIPLLAKNAILGEERGEVETAILNFNGYSTDYIPDGLKEIHKELIQVAAVTLAFLESISNSDGEPRARDICDYR